ncbi:hypothetical protein FGO68_gene5379 [Halteria grandinella]|uniref:Uncharacterized protein n=1 Tax=Halteria grandinella TaxID=5974 RepID=A0A8J8P1U0_HALGN|nr:hypothetical protein FGO68_gene5379 [Halteria grandinella]
MQFRLAVIAMSAEAIDMTQKKFQSLKSFKCRNKHLISVIAQNKLSHFHTLLKTKCRSKAQSKRTMFCSLLKTKAIKALQNQISSRITLNCLPPLLLETNSIITIIL